MQLHLNEMHTKIQDHQTNMSSLQREHEKSKEELRQLQAQIDTLSSQLSEKDREIGNLKVELELHEEKAHHSGVSGGQLKEVVGEMVRGEEGKEHDSTGGSVQLESMLAQVKGDLNSYKQQLEAAKAELSEAVAAKSNLVGLLTAREQEVESLTEIVQKNEHTDVESKAVTSKLHADKEEVIKKLETLTSEKASLEATVLMLEAKIRRMEEEGKDVRNTDERLKALEQENVKCTKQLVNLKAHLIEVCTRELWRLDTAHVIVKAPTSECNV